MTDSNLDRNEILDLNETFYRAFEKKDLQLMSSIWYRGTTSVCIHPGGKVLQGWEEIRHSWEKIFRNTNYFEINTEAIAIEVGDRLSYIVSVENVLQVNRGRKLQANSTATNVFEKMAQKWYLVHHHGSPVLR